MPLKVHFLNVGHGDCTFIELPSGRLMMIDINNSTSIPEDDKAALALDKGLTLDQFKSASLALTAAGVRMSWEDYYQSLLVDPFDYYVANFKGQAIFRYVQTHPDLDHMSGLHRFFWQEKVDLINFWDTDHDKELEESDFLNSRYSYLDWVVYQILRGGSGPDETKVKSLEIYRNDLRKYWDDDDIEILSPTKEIISSCKIASKYNDLSYVLRISYGGRSMILPGDAESLAWESMKVAYTAEQLDCDVLKASHHGRHSGYDKEAVDLMNPEYVICSVGKKPTTDASKEYAKHGSSVFSTRYQGSIVVTMWHDGEVWFDSSVNGRIGSLSPL